MKWFYDLRIATKLITSFLVVLALTALIGVFSILQLGAVNSSSTEIRDNWMPSMRAASGMRFQVANYRVKESRHILSDSAAEKAQMEVEAAESKKQVDIRRATYEPLIASPEERTLYEAFVGDWEAYLAASKTLFEASRQNSVEDAKAILRGESKRTYEASINDLEKLVILNDAGAATASKRGDDLFASSRLSIIATLIAAWWLACYSPCSSHASFPVL